MPIDLLILICTLALVWAAVAAGTCAGSGLDGECCDSGGDGGGGD